MVRVYSCWMWPLAVAAVCNFIAPAAAGEAPAPASVTELEPLIRQLEAAEFSERQAASQKLIEAGAAALPALERAAESKNREVSGRALDILKAHFAGDDAPLKQAAAEALKRLSHSANSSIAQRASNVLHPPAEPQAIAGPLPNPIFGGPRIPVMGPGGQGFPAAPGQNIRLSIRTREANGQRDVEVEENDRKIQLRTLPTGNIEIDITERQNGRDVTRKVAAKNLDDLKRNDAEAGQLYERFGGDGAAVLRGLQARAPGPVERPAGPGAQRPAFGGPAPSEARKRLIEHLDQQIEQLKAQAANDPTAQRRLEAFERHTQQLKQQLEPAQR